MEIRNKRFGHIDANHEVRSDELLWQLRVEGNVLLAEASSMTGSRLALPSFSKMVSYLEWIDLLRGNICVQENKLKDEVNELLGRIEILDTIVRRNDC